MSWREWRPSPLWRRRGIAEQRRRAKHQSIDNAEHRRVRADPESKGEHDRRGEAGLGAKPAEGVTDVLRHRLEECNGTPSRMDSRRLISFITPNLVFAGRSRVSFLRGTTLPEKTLKNQGLRSTVIG
jgi:hypothetical protein